MNWILAEPYLKKIGPGGLWDSASNMDKTLNFILSPPNYEHNPFKKQSGLKDWKDYWQHSDDIWRKARENNCGIITTFPQLPACVGLRKRILKKDLPIIAWTFNLGALHGNIKKMLAQFALNQVNKFIVHSTAECAIYSQYLNLPENLFEFIPLHRALSPIIEQEELDQPFILSMGAANRDYATLFRAIKRINIPLTVVAPQHCLAGLDIPPSVTIRSNLSMSECRKLIQQARINIIPVDNKSTASGQVTILEAMVHARAVIATNTIGTSDYIVNGSTGILVSPKNPDELGNAIDTLWNNELLRTNIAKNAYQYVSTELTMNKTRDRLIKILDSFN
jgi:glycosyltransferase involved in cell wall biosynthesis